MAIGNVTGTLSYQWTGLVLPTSGGVVQSWGCEVVQWVNLDVIEELLQRNWSINLILQYVSSSWSVVAWWKGGTMTGHNKNLVAYCVIYYTTWYKRLKVYVISFSVFTPLFHSERCNQYTSLYFRIQVSLVYLQTLLVYHFNCSWQTHVPVTNIQPWIGYPHEIIDYWPIYIGYIPFWIPEQNLRVLSACD